MISHLRVWWFGLRRDRPDRPLLTQMRDLWQVPEDWTHKPTARVLPKRKVLSVEDWKRQYDHRRSA